MIEYAIIIIAIILTAITSQIPNDIIPTLSFSQEVTFLIALGGDCYGYPFPFLISIGWVQEIDWISFIIDVGIFLLIIWMIVGLYEKCKRDKSVKPL